MMALRNVKGLIFEGYSLPDVHRVQLNFSNGISLNYHNWKSCFKKLSDMLSKGIIDVVTFDKCGGIINEYL